MSFLDTLFAKKDSHNGATGAKIRKIRNRKQISARELGDACGVNEVAVRNYERGTRQISDEKLEAIAKRLGISVSALYDRKISSYVDAMHVLFELSEEYELQPIALPQVPPFGIVSKNESLVKLIEAWYSKRREWEQKKISLEELRDWEDAFPLQCSDEAFTRGEDDKSEPYLTEIEKTILQRKAIEDLKLIIRAQTEQISECLEHNDVIAAQHQLAVFKRTVDAIIASDIKKYW